MEGGRIAGNYIISCLKQMGIKPLLAGDYIQPFDVYHAERQVKGKRWQVHPDSIAELKKVVHQKLALRNILGKIEGKNPNEIVIIGAHYDHIGYDPMLEGDQIYNGADDNASGVQAVLQVARAFLATGEQPERTVIFAFWDGEEKGLLGSRYFAMNYPDIKKVKGYLNYDMIGRNNREDQPDYFVYFYTAAHQAFGDWLKKILKITACSYPLTTGLGTIRWEAATTARSPNWEYLLYGITLMPIPIITFREMKHRKSIG